MNFTGIKRFLCGSDLKALVDTMYVRVPIFYIFCRLLIPLFISMSCQGMCKKKVFNTGLVFPENFA